jgi:hypothetical protein
MEFCDSGTLREALARGLTMRPTSKLLRMQEVGQGWTDGRGQGRSWRLLWAQAGAGSLLP